MMTTKELKKRADMIVAVKPQYSFEFAATHRTLNDAFEGLQWAATRIDELQDQIEKGRQVLESSDESEKKKINIILPKANLKIH